MLRRTRRRNAGRAPGALDRAGALERLAALGIDGERARMLDEAVGKRQPGLRSLSELSAALAVSYLERISRPLGALSLDTGAFATTRGYVAHMVVEADPGSFGASNLPVIEVPPPRHGVAPRDLLMRLVKASRRDFESVCAVPAEVWSGYVITTTWRMHDMVRKAAAKGEEPVLLDAEVIEALARLGWLLRQVDLQYGLAPELAS